MGVQSTDEPTLKALIETTIHGLTPTITSRQASTWELRSRKSTPGHRTRSFRVIFSDYEEGPTDEAGWTTAGMRNVITVTIETDYSVPHDEVMPLIMADHRQLLDVLSALKKTDSNGVWWVESIGPPDPPDDDSADHWQVDHDFEVHYQTSRSF